MCGICGQWAVAGRAGNGAQLTAAVQAMRHRGPNDCGQEVRELNGSRLMLGHTRLSIIDLSEGGHQPMYREEKRYSMIYNGEVYNYRELRRELEALGDRFASDSDSEVLLAAWVRWREDALPRLRGMFAFAIFDAREQTITLARDAFGIKPLAYYAEAGHFAFASEIPALRHLLPGGARLNRQRAYDYLVHGSYDDSEQTFFEGIRHLLPGHVLEFDARAGTITRLRRWWWPDVGEQLISFEDAAARVREMFLTNVRLHLRSDVALGAALSGGIDSSAIVCGMRHVEPDMPIHTFSYVARGSSVNEERWADLVNERVGAIVHKVTATPQELVRDLESMIRAQGEPFGSTSIYAQYRVFQLARESGITVTLEGQGADELFAGYSGYPGPVLRELVRSGRPLEALSFLRAWSRWPGRSFKHGLLLFAQQVTPDALRGLGLSTIGRPAAPSWLDERALRDTGVRLKPPLMPAEFRTDERFLSAMLRFALVHQGMPGLLRHGDRNAMRWSIESRVPFLTTDLAEFVLRLPDHYLISRGGETKHVLRAALRGIVPDAILDRRDKIGFATPEEDWFRQVSDQIRGWLDDDVGVDFLRQDVIRRQFDEIMAGQRPFSWQVWRWINFIHWHKLFLS